MCGPLHRPGTGREPRGEPCCTWVSPAGLHALGVTWAAGSCPDNGAAPPREQEATHGRRKNRAGAQPAALAREGRRRVRKGCGTEGPERRESQPGKAPEQKAGCLGEGPGGHGTQQATVPSAGRPAAFSHGREATASLPLLFSLENSILCFVLNLLAKEMLFSQNGHIEEAQCAPQCLAAVCRADCLAHVRPQGALPC